MVVVAGSSFKVTIHIQTLRTFLFSYSCFTALQKSSRFSLFFNYTSHLHMQYKALCTVVLVNKRQWLNSKKALDETATTIGISNQRHNHFLLEICSCKMSRNTHSALKSIFMQRSNSSVRFISSQFWSVNVNQFRDKELFTVSLWSRHVFRKSILDKIISV